MLMDGPNATRKAVATYLLYQYDTGGEGILSHIVVGDETLVHHFQPESKLQSMEWCHMTSQQRRRNSSLCYQLKNFGCICLG